MLLVLMVLAINGYKPTNYKQGMVEIRRYIDIASGLRATTYGWGKGDKHCGDIGKPVECRKGLYTASGEIFDPQMPQMALAAPTRLRMVATVLPVRLEEGKCRFLRLVDKMNPRYISVRGFDLTPASVKLLGGHATKYWSGNVTVCYNLLNKQLTKIEVIKWNLK